MKRAQVSMEYIIIVGFVFVLLIPMMLIYYDFRSDTQDSINTNHAYKIAKSIADQAESVFYLGEPSRTILKMNFPGRIQTIEFNDFEIVFTLQTTNGFDDIVIPSAVNVTGNLDTSPGIHHIIIESKGDYVEVRE